jgi:tape measure domain-containing protein
MTQTEKLIIEINAQTAGLKTQLSGITSQLKGMDTAVSSSVNRMNLGFAAMGLSVVGLARGIFNIGKASLQASAQWESLNAAFKTMIGNEKEALQLTKDLRLFAAKTPLQLMGVAETSKTLLQYGVAARDIMPTIKMLGDVSMGNQEKLDRLAIAFGQVRGNGRLMGQELRQMIEAGFNPLEEISDRTGKTVAELRKEMAAGIITVEMVEQAFKDATSEGGRFFGAMEAQAKTLKGLWSNLEDSATMAASSIGDIVREVFNLDDAIIGVSNSLQDFNKNMPGKDTQAFSGIVSSLQTIIILLGIGLAKLVVWPILLKTGFIDKTIKVLKLFKLAFMGDWLKIPLDSLKGVPKLFLKPFENISNGLLKFGNIKLSMKSHMEGIAQSFKFFAEPFSRFGANIGKVFANLRTAPIEAVKAFKNLKNTFGSGLGGFFANFSANVTNMKINFVSSLKAMGSQIPNLLNGLRLVGRGVMQLGLNIGRALAPYVLLGAAIFFVVRLMAVQKQRAEEIFNKNQARINEQIKTAAIMREAAIKDGKIKEDEMTDLERKQKAVDDLKAKLTALDNAKRKSILGFDEINTIESLDNRNQIQIDLSAAEEDLADAQQAIDDLKAKAEEEIPLTGLAKFFADITKIVDDIVKVLLDSDSPFPKFLRFVADWIGDNPEAFVNLAGGLMGIYVALELINGLKALSGIIRGIAAATKVLATEAALANTAVGLSGLLGTLGALALVGVIVVSIMVIFDYIEKSKKLVADRKRETEEQLDALFQDRLDGKIGDEEYMKREMILQNQLDKYNRSLGESFLDMLAGAFGLRENVGQVDKYGNPVPYSYPATATGGITTGPSARLVGEAGKEAILPLENNTGWMDMLAERLGGGEKSINNNIYLDGNLIYQNNRKYSQRDMLSTGGYA